MSNKRVLVLVLAAVAIGFCPEAASAQDLLQPQFATPSGARAASPQKDEAEKPIKITLADALRRARALNPAYQLSLTNAMVAEEASKQARDANLPSVSYASQYLYTQGNGTPTGVFIANNAVHEYIAQGDVHELLSATSLAQYRSSVAAAALARDHAEIQSRGLVVTVVSSYALLVAAKSKLQTLEEALSAAQEFLKITRELESGGEVANADVIKAEIQLSDSQVAVENAKDAEQQARDNLALLIFPNLNQPFELVDDPGKSLALPTFAEAEAEAKSHNPSLQAAQNAKREAADNVTVAWTDYLPTLTLDSFYGIDATHFAAWSPDPTGQIRNLGYSAWAQLNLPIWNWGATHSKVKQAEDLNRQAALELSFASRKLATDLKRVYSDARAAKAEIQIRQTASSYAAESLKLTLLQYKAGQATALQAVNAEQTVSLERDALADAEARYATAIANLSTLTGSL